MTPTKETAFPAQQRSATAVTHVVNRRSSVVARSQCVNDVPPKVLPANTVSLAAMANGHAPFSPTLHCSTEDRLVAFLQTTLIASTSHSILKIPTCSQTTPRSIAHLPQERISTCSTHKDVEKGNTVSIMDNSVYRKCISFNHENHGHR